jgi:hypothetical protein
MYRQYEDPYMLEKKIEELKKQYRQAIEQNADEDILTYLACDIAELKERINFAWQDDEEEL